jgi:site-specific recombinase XerD
MDTAPQRFWDPEHEKLPVSPGLGIIPALVLSAGEQGAYRFLEFFAAHIRNPNTRAAYFREVCAFLLWCQRRKIHELSEIRSHHVAGYVERLGTTHAPPSVKQHLAAIRMLFDWLVVGQIVPQNPASAVRGPTYVVKKGKTPVLLGEVARALLDRIPTDTPVRLRDRAFISLRKVARNTRFPATTSWKPI